MFDCHSLSQNTAWLFDFVWLSDLSSFRVLENSNCRYLDVPISRPLLLALLVLRVLCNLALCNVCKTVVLIVLRDVETDLLRLLTDAHGNEVVHQPIAKVAHAEGIDEDDEDGTEVEIEGSEAPHFDTVKMMLGNYENIEWFTDDIENTYDEYEERLRMEYGVMHLTDLLYYERWHDEDMNRFSELGKWNIDD